MLKRYFLRKVKQWLEKHGAAELVRKHSHVILETYAHEREIGTSEEEAVLAACRRMLTHII